MSLGCSIYAVITGLPELQPVWKISQGLMFSPLGVFCYRDREVKAWGSSKREGMDEVMCKGTDGQLHSLQSSHFSPASPTSEDVHATTCSSQLGFHLRFEKMLPFFPILLSCAFSISPAQSIEDQIPEDSSLATYLTKLPTVWFNVWKFLDEPKNSPRSSKVHPPTKKQLTFRRRKGPRKGWGSQKKHRSDVLQEKQFVLVPPPPPAGRFPIFFRRRPQSIFTRLALGAQVFYGNLAFLGG